jgi:hypothetical protein
MNSKINELRALIRREIKRSLSEDINTDVMVAKKAKLDATKKLADLEKKKADKDVADAQKGI